ncbi:MAG: hypothetical protein NTX42_04295 [Methanothrix sp.]|nr:hypothetical protein [Methanothrix sp.]
MLEDVDSSGEITKAKDGKPAFEAVFEALISALKYLNQPVFITLLLTSIFYIVVSIYYISFFNRLSLPFYTLNLPLSFYLSAGNDILNIILFIFLALPVGYLLFQYVKYYFYSIIILSIFILDKIWKVFSLKSSILSSVREKIGISGIKAFKLFLLYDILTVIALIVIINFVDSNFPRIATRLNPYNQFLIFNGIIIATTIFAFILIISFPKIYNKRVYYFLFCASLFIISLLLITTIPSKFGYDAAEDVINGRGDRFEMNSISTENNMIDPNASFILIMQCNGNYYLIKKDVINFSDTPNLYIIPEKQLRMAKTKWISGTSKER